MAIALSSHAAVANPFRFRHNDESKGRSWPAVQACHAAFSTGALPHRCTSPHAHQPPRPNGAHDGAQWSDARAHPRGAVASTPMGPSAPPPLKARAHVIIFDCHPHHSPTRRGTSPPPGTGRPKRRAVSDTRRFGHAPSLARVASVDAAPARVLARARMQALTTARFTAAPPSSAPRLL